MFVMVTKGNMLQCINRETVLLFILTVCVVAMLVNQVKHDKRVDEICDRIKKV